MKKKLTAGDRVRTSGKYEKLISKTPRSGVLEKELTWITGLWRVRLLDFEKVQHVHANFLERVE